MTRVLSTDQARASIDRIRSLANDQLTSDLSALQAEGSTLSDPNIWDGLEAARFRGGHVALGRPCIEASRFRPSSHFSSRRSRSTRTSWPPVGNA